MEVMKLSRFYNTVLILFLLVACHNKNEVYDSEGNLRYRIDKDDSTAVVYSKNGQTYMSGKFINQKKAGIWTEYLAKSNDKIFEWTYVNDKKEGLFRGYTMTGKIQTIGYYREDKLDSVLVYFNLEGRPKKVEVWKADPNTEGTSDLIFSKDIE